MPTPRLFLIDATAFCYRAFYAIRSLSTSSGQPTNAVYGFLRMLGKLIKQNKPEYLAVCFDVSRKTFRQEKFAEYKANRQAMPDGLSSQIPLIKEIIRAYRIPLYEKEGFEADDIIATLAHKAKKHHVAATVISADKDLLQLVDDSICVLNPHKDEPAYDVSRVKEKFGVDPHLVTDLVAFIGDSVDNIPAIKGISEKKALGLIAEFGSVEQIIDNADNINPEKIRKAVIENTQQIKLNKELAQLDKNVDIDFQMQAVAVQEPDYAQLYRIFQELEFKALLKDLPVVVEQSGPGLLQARPAELKELLNVALAKQEIFLGAGKDNSYVLAADGLYSEVGPILPEDLKQVLADPKVKKAGHDLKAITVQLASQGVVLGGLDFDTLVAAYLVNPSRPAYTLEDLAWEFLKQTLMPQAVPAAQKAGVLLELKVVLAKILQEHKLDDLFSKVEMPLVEILALMEIEGIRIDCDKLKKLSQQLEQRLAILIAKIYGLCGCEFNINSPKQLREVLFEKLGLPVVKKTKTGPSTDEEVLRTLASRHDLPAMLLEYRQMTKLKSTYIDALPDMVNVKTCRLHTSFNQAGTETGRLSSRNPNLQNIPIKTDLGRSIRQAVIAFDNQSLLLSCDYSQIELRILAHISADKTLIEAFRVGADIHRRTAALVNSVPEAQVTEQMRSFAKRINFGIVYGLSAYGLARDLNISHEQAQQFIDAYFLQYPGVKEYMYKQVELAEAKGFVTTLLGRRRYLPEIKDRNQAVRQFAQRQAINTPIQGSASDMIKLAMVNIHRKIKNEGFGGKMILQIHDELLFNVPKKELAEFSIMVKKEMEQGFALIVPVKIDMQAGPNWLDMEQL